MSGVRALVSVSGALRARASSSVARAAVLSSRVSAAAAVRSVHTTSSSFAAAAAAASSASSSSSSSGVLRFALGAAVGVAAGSAAAAAVVLADAVDYAAVRADIAKLLSSNEDMGPTLVRLAWHASGTYDKNAKNGGSDGATMRYNPEKDDGANAGLHLARAFLQPIKDKYPAISYADLWTLAAVVAIEAMAGPKIAWRAGRTDKAADDASRPPAGRLPAADKGASRDTASHIRQVFNRMGFNDQEIVALAGAHALGRCHRDRSGYDGPWTNAPTTFSNEYFRELLENKWTVRKWDGPRQFQDPSGTLMMLPADMMFIEDPAFRVWVEKYAKDEDLFFRDFAAAFQKLEELGCSGLKDEAAASKKPAGTFVDALFGTVKGFFGGK